MGALVVSLLVAAAAVAPAAAPAAGSAESDGQPRTELSLLGGLTVLALSLDAEVRTPWNLVVGGGVGDMRGPAVNGYLGYHVALGPHWGLRPGFRASHARSRSDSCPDRCSYDFALFEAALRYRGPSGFVFEFGLPLLAWLPVEPAAGETGPPHLQRYTLATGEAALVGTLLLGYAF